MSGSPGVEGMEAHRPTERGTANVYCVVPLELETLLAARLARFYAGSHTTVIIDRRRRSGPLRDFGDERRGHFVAFRPAARPAAIGPNVDRLRFVREPDAGLSEVQRHDPDRVIRRAQNGDANAMAALYEKYRAELYSYVLAIVRDAHDAEDAVQEIFARALKALPKYDFRRPVRNWLLVIARNHGVDVAKQRGRTRLDDPAALTRLSDGGSRPLVAIPDGTLELLELIAKLPLLQRQVLALHYLVDLRLNDIAEILVTQPEYVRQAKARALANIRRVLIAAPAPPPRAIRVQQRPVAKPAPYGFSTFGWTACRVDE